MINGIIIDTIWKEIRWWLNNQEKMPNIKNVITEITSTTIETIRKKWQEIYIPMTPPEREPISTSNTPINIREEVRLLQDYKKPHLPTHGVNLEKTNLRIKKNSNRHKNSRGSTRDIRTYRSPKNFPLP